MKFKILATSDVHGFIMPYEYADNKAQDMGFIGVYKAMSEMMDENTLLIDNGDILEGSPFLSYYYRFMNGCHIMAKLMNMTEYQYFNLGNHDFNYGIDNLLNYINNTNAKCITGNVKYNGKVLGQDYTIHNFKNGIKIALIGVVTDYLRNWEKPENLVGIEIENAFDYVKKTVSKVKKTEDVDAIVVVYHGGIERDLSTGKPTEKLTGENEGYRMLKEIKDLDILISGHQHRSIASKVFGKLVSQTADKAKEFASIDYDVATKDGEVTLIKATNEMKKDIYEAAKDVEINVQKWLDTPLGRVVDENLEIKDEFDARLNKHPLMTFLNKVAIAQTGADLAGNALFNGARGFKKDITMRDIVSTYVYPNTLVVYEITGAILKKYLEKTAEYFAIEDGEIVVSKGFSYPKPQHFNYDMIDGVDYTIKVSNRTGQRIIELKYQGEDVKEDDVFSLAISNYRASGGGNYFMFKGCKVLYDKPIDMVTIISDYIDKHKEIYVQHHPNIKVII